jgi:hypothetical protein
LPGTGRLSGRVRGKVRHGGWSPRSRVTKGGESGSARLGA